MARRWLFYLALNVLVSAVTMLAVLYLWDRSRQPAAITVPKVTALPAGMTTKPGSELPSPTPRTYIVQKDDTLTSIAEKFGVDIDEIIAINNIEDPDSLTPGQTLIIPPGAPSSLADSRHPTVTPQEGESFPWPVIKDVISPGDLKQERVEIFNPGPKADLTGWQVCAPSGARYVFAEFSIYPNGGVFVYTTNGVDTSIDVYWGLSAAVWKTGDEVRLLDSLGNLRSVFVIP
jgi:murein DD-endopeptidase MepM/ murein hydrolase activator NlpD